MSNLSNLLWDNWSNWSNGGLDEDSIQKRISDSDLNTLLSWIDSGYSQFKMVRPLLKLKAVVDIATWCLHGTHSLLLLTSEIRQRRLQEESEHLDIPVDILSWLIGTTRLLENQP